MTRTWVLTWLVVGWVGVAGAQEARLSDWAVREAAYRFLTLGPDSLWPGLRQRELAAARVERRADGAGYSVLLGRVEVELTTSLKVCGYRGAVRSPSVPRWVGTTSRPLSEVEAEISLISRLDSRDLEAFARAFLRRVYGAGRTFELRDLHRYLENPLDVSLVFVEESPAGDPGAPNLATVMLCPQTGQVTWFFGTRVNERVPANRPGGTPLPGSGR